MMGTAKRSAMSASASRRLREVVAVVGFSSVGLLYSALGLSV